MVHSKQVENAKASDRVIEAIRHQILAERLPAGTSLSTEVELMDRYQLGRVSVRESLRVLERDGLVKIKRGRGGGVCVAEPDIGRASEHIAVLMAYQDTPVRDFVSFRRVFEPQAAALAAMNATDEQRSEVARHLRNERDQLCDAAGFDSPEQASRESGFHGLVASISGNGMIELISRVVGASFSSRVHGRVISLDLAESTVEAHERIGHSIISAAADSAAAAMSDHIDAYEEIMGRFELLDQPIISSDEFGN